LVKGKPWTIEEEKKLAELLKSEKPLGVIAESLNKSPEAVVKKIRRLKLEVVVPTLQHQTTTTKLVLPKELPSVEEALKMLAAALKASCKPGLDKVEVQRLQVVATLARTYKELLADYINYRGIEAELAEMKEQCAAFAKKVQGAAG